MSARRRTSSKKSTPKTESFQGIGRTMSVLSFVVTLLLGLTITMVCIVYLIRASRSARVTAMIHSKKIVSKSQCGGSNTVCVGLVFTHKSKDYTLNMEVPDSADLELGKTVNLVVDVRDPSNSTTSTFVEPTALLPLSIAIWSIGLIIGIVLIVLAFYKISVNMSNPSVADATGRYHLSSWI